MYKIVYNNVAIIESRSIARRLKLRELRRSSGGPAAVLKRSEAACANPRKPVQTHANLQSCCRAAWHLTLILTPILTNVIAQNLPAILLRERPVRY